VPQGINYNPRPEGCERVVIREDIISRHLNYLEQNGYLKILTGCVWRNGGHERVLIALQYLSTIKKSTSHFNFNFLKFLRQHFLQKKPYMPQGITYKPCLEGCEGNVILKNIFSGLFNNVEQNGYLKILIGCVWRNGGCERGVSYPSFTFDY
jgi:hypothetical protein